MEWDSPQQRSLEILKQGKSVFLSGKAGSGKSSILREFCQYADDVVICAPTGLAALNIGGTTIHSLFELPVIHTPMIDDEPGDNTLITQITLEMLKLQPLSAKRRRLLQRAKTVVIDEVSLVRADIFDAINWRRRFGQTINKRGQTKFRIMSGMFGVTGSMKRTTQPKLCWMPGELRNRMS